MFKDKIAEMECNEDCGRLGLKDFLVKPYQRLTKYPLLMKDIKEALMPYSVEPKKDDKAKRFTQAEKDEELEKRKCELAEKDRIIEEMRLEMERMKCSLLTNIPSESPAKEPDVETIVVEEATSF